MVHSRRSPIADHACAGGKQVQRRIRLVNQRVPSSSSHSLFERRQHAFRPDARVRPTSNRGRLSGGFSRERHCHRFVILFPWLGHHASIFLRPFAPPALPGFVTTMGALPPGRSALRILIRDNEHRPLHRSGLLVSCIETSDRSASIHRLPSSGLGFAFPPRLTARSADRIPCLGPERHLGFTYGVQARHDNGPNRVRHPTDRQFTSSCSPRPLARTQLLSVTKFKPNLDKDLHLADSIHLQLHTPPSLSRSVNKTEWLKTRNEKSYSAARPPEAAGVGTQWGVVRRYVGVALQSASPTEGSSVGWQLRTSFVAASAFRVLRVCRGSDLRAAKRRGPGKKSRVKAMSQMTPEKFFKSLSEREFGPNPKRFSNFRDVPRDEDNIYRGTLCSVNNLGTVGSGQWIVSSGKRCGIRDE